MAETTKEHRLEGDRCGLAEHKRQDWVVQAEQGVTLKVLQDEAYWANFASKFKPWDRIEVRTDDGTLWCELLVLSCGRNWAKVHVLRHSTLQTKDVEQTQVDGGKGHTYYWQHRGPRKHSIIRDDKQVMHEGADTKDQALQWAADNGYKVGTAPKVTAPA